MRLACLIAVIIVAFPQLAFAQIDVAAQPIVGLRDDRPGSYALVHADVVVAPGEIISNATVLVQGTALTAVGRDVQIPSGYEVIDCRGKRIYAGLIDAWSEIDVPVQQSKSGYWNQNVTPHRNAAQSAVSLSDAAKLRSQGITARLVAPGGGIVKGTSSVVLLDAAKAGRTLLRPKAWQHLQLTVPRSGTREPYPNSPMGATALLRQSLHDARWYLDAWDAYRANPELPRPETNLALQELSQAVLNDTFVFDAPNERMAIRADVLAKEFALRAILRGSGREYRELASIVAANRPVLLPVDFPKVPDVQSAQSLERLTLQELMHWDLAPENPARLAEAGVKICLTTDGLDDVGQYLKQVRVAVERGLSADAALSAMTTVPAELLGIEEYAGRVQVGKLANLAITDGDLFAPKTKVVECWVAGKRFEISTPPNHSLTSQITGTWSMQFRSGDANVSLQLVLHEKNDKLEGTVQPASTDENTNASADSSTESGRRAAQQGEEEETDDSGNDDDDVQDDDEVKESKQEAKVPSTKLKDLVRERDRITATLNLHDVDTTLADGVSLLTLILVKADVPSQHPMVFATIGLPSGQTSAVELRFLESKQSSASSDEETKGESDSGAKSTGPSEGQTDEKEKNEEAEDADETQGSLVDAGAATPLLFPLGAYGLESPIRAQSTVLLRGATLWTCDDAGVIESGDLLISDGVITAVGTQLDAPPDCQIIDLRGKHITPGLIDCHSHMATDGGINESGQAVTAEVRISDFIDNSDMNIYRQLAGGLTTSNILHGSANPIGGQNQVIKLRWGETMDGMLMKEAPKGIKFALGENVKRNQSRYPNTRMGVEQIIRDQLLAAREYHSTWRRWRAGERGMLPPRIDLQLEALAEVQQGSRWIHCHSYRQDEIVATLDVLEEFGIQIGTLQHILEGYKVADRMAQHGAMGSSFSDWWAYKFEVLDAIPYNGALMHDRGVVVSFNSDDRELARHLNTEAAKATKYGAVPEQEALKFVTLNPARQLRIDQYVGSLTPGKQADVVVWSGRPLSTLSRCEQSWIDGRLYFDLEAEARMRSRDAALRARLIQKARGAGNSASTRPDDKEKVVEEEDRWVRSDIYCATHGGLRHETIDNGGNQ